MALFESHHLANTMPSPIYPLPGSNYETGDVTDQLIVTLFNVYVVRAYITSTTTSAATSKLLKPKKSLTSTESSN